MATKFGESCACGARFDYEVETESSYVREYIAEQVSKWRSEHRHTSEAAGGGDNNVV